jgi:hypothetical protein
MSVPGDAERMSRIFGGATDTAAKERLFPGGTPLPPAMGVPDSNEQARDRFRRIAQGDGGGQVEAWQTGKTLSPETLAKAELFVRKFAALLQNGNITAALPTYNSPHLWSQPIDLSATASIPAAVNANWTTVISYTVQPGQLGRIDGYGVNVRDPAYTYDGSLLWRILRNGVGVPNLSNWGEQRGSVIQPRNTFIVLREGDLITFQVRRAVLAAAAQSVEMALTGWTWKPRNSFEGTKSGINVA